jgi:hypothetical protein
MKHGKTPVIFTVFLAALIVLGGCSGGGGGGGDSTPTFDNAESGIMSGRTASRIFEFTEGPDGVTITGFKSALELAAYLGRSESRAAITIDFGDKFEFVLPTINNRPVVALGDNAFAPKDTEGTALIDLNTDITTVVSKVILPSTIKELGKDLFAGATEAVNLDIPKTVIDTIVAKAQAADPDAQMSQETVLKEVVGAVLVPVLIQATTPDTPNVAPVTVVEVTEEEAAQGDTRLELAAGSPDTVNGFSVGTTVTFTGAGTLELTKDHFTVSGGALIESASNSGGIVSVTVSFPVNQSPADKIYTVGIHTGSKLITGAAFVTITQKSQSQTVAITGSAAGRLEKYNDAYYLKDESGSVWKGPLSGNAAAIAAALDTVNPGKLGYFDLSVTNASTLTATEGVILVSSRIEAGTSISSRNIVTIPKFGAASSFANAASLAAATPVYIEDYETGSYASEYGENSTILVKGGAFVFIPFRDTAANAKAYGKQNYKGIVRVENGGALLDQGAAGFSIGPAGYWFDYGSIALIQAEKDYKSGSNYISGYNPLAFFENPPSGKSNGFWIGPNFSIGSNSSPDNGPYAKWEATDVSPVNGSGSFVWVAGSTFAVNGKLTIARDFALSQDLKILPNSSLVVGMNLALGYPTDTSDRSILPIALSAAELSPLGLSGGATGGQTVVLSSGKAIVGHDYPTNSSAVVVNNATGSPVTYVPGTPVNSTYSTEFPWKVE